MEEINRAYGSGQLTVTLHDEQHERAVYAALPKLTSKAGLRRIGNLMMDRLSEARDPDNYQPTSYPREAKISRRDLNRLATRGIISKLKHDQAILGTITDPRNQFGGLRLVSSTARQVDRTLCCNAEVDPSPTDESFKVTAIDDRPVDYQVDFPEHVDE